MSIEVAREFQPDAHVLYVDNDPMVCAHARALLATNDGVAAIHGDIRAPQTILNDPDHARPDRLQPPCGRAVRRRAALPDR